MDSLEILRESFDLLIRRPKVFFPKLFSTVTASLFLVFLLSSRSILTSFTPAVLVSFMFASLVAISVIAAFSSMMLSSMIKQDDYSLLNSLKQVVSKLPNALKLALAAVLTAFMISLIPVSGYWVYLTSGSLAAVAVSVLAFVLLLLGISYASYFLPITLLENKDFRTSFSTSLRTSNSNSKTVTALLLFSLVLITVAFLSTGFLEKLGYVGFVAGRVVSSILNTYIFVVSPKYYLESKKNGIK